MRVRFWGTRGSLPVALTTAGLRAKMRRLLREASGRTFSSDEAIDEYLSAQPFEVAGTYGGHSSCVEIESGNGEYVLCDLLYSLYEFWLARIAPLYPGNESLKIDVIFDSHVVPRCRVFGQLISLQLIKVCQPSLVITFPGNPRLGSHFNC
jgi:hypothetical protein